MLLTEGLWLMVVGMTVVFSFLIFLVIVMYLSASFFEAFAEYFPDPPSPETTGPSGQDQSQIAAVLAVVHHAQNHK